MTKTDDEIYKDIKGMSIRQKRIWIAVILLTVTTLAFSKVSLCRFTSWSAPIDKVVTIILARRRIGGKRGKREGEQSGNLPGSFVTRRVHIT